ncbi:MAG: undecaprenyldiphospho-muramoylpentapeptide beta-N-acetylglucosaminyltransferase [Sphingobacteriales bacterium]|nr:undecaprenyldiphospho-muramoylpentapeptide beta-N-acetylglucosaminyltransferase [Sphingobacteriales bacterium]
MKRIILSGGGTGGHLFPAIAVANALRRLQPDVELLFVGAQGRIEMEKVPQAGYRIEGLWISGLQRSLSVQNLLFPIKLGSSLWRSYRILRRFRPGAVVGTGGYASGALLQVAAWLRIPTLIQEQNSYPGITNKLLAPYAHSICLAYDDARRFFPTDKITMTGNPVRDNIRQFETADRNQAFEHFGLSPTQAVLLVTGGSLGARGINNGILTHIDKFRQNNIQLLWQCGKLYYEELQAAVAAYTDTIKLLPFIDRMDYAYALADAVVSRAGASAISELCIVGKPTLLMPSPNVAEDHQTANAQSLVKRQAALMIRDADAPEQLYEAIGQLFDPIQSAVLRQNIKQLAIYDAAETIAQKVLDL